ncbi:MAG TPA: IS256 family transposase [Candidatus Paceibacterota bacterium]|nr:IS256 family transposase [Candidatus Paceibacterota bacterium]
MKKDNLIALPGRDEPVESQRSVLDELAREGARRMLQAALETEVADYLEHHQTLLDDDGHRLVVRNGHLPERDLITGVGPVRLTQPRVRDKRDGEKFTSKILPPFLRRAPSVDALIPVLYLKGVSTGDFSEALAAILGPNAAGLSPTNVVRLKEGWKKDYETWSSRGLSAKKYVYWWADGIYFNVRLDRDRPCMLVLMGALEDGKKELVGIHDGHRESKASWLTLLRGLKRQGLTATPKLAVGDGALGFWAAVEEAFPGVTEQRCWVHKTSNILDKMPKSVQPDAKKLIHEMYLSPTREAALKAFDEFKKRYKAKYPKAVDCLDKDKDVLFAFYDFPAEHWLHLRTTNPIESTFATVRHRTRQTKGCGSRLATLTMVFKLALEAERSWRRLNGHQLIAKVIEGVKFVDGVLKEAAA